MPPPNVPVNDCSYRSLKGGGKVKPCALVLLLRLCTCYPQAGGNGSATKREQRERWRRQSPPMRWQ
jgi:hypothetical protein